MFHSAPRAPNGDRFNSRDCTINLAELRLACSVFGAIRGSRRRTAEGEGGLGEGGRGSKGFFRSQSRIAVTYCANF